MADRAMQSMLPAIRASQEPGNGSYAHKGGITDIEEVASRTLGYQPRGLGGLPRVVRREHRVEPARARRQWVA